MDVVVDAREEEWKAWKDSFIIMQCHRNSVTKTENTYPYLTDSIGHDAIDIRKAL